MKVFHKIFLSFVVLFSLTLQAAGFLLLRYSWENAIEQEKKYAWNEFQYNQYILQSLLYQKPTLLDGGKTLSGLEKSFTTKLALYDEENQCLFSSLSAEVKAEQLSFEEEPHYQMSYNGEENCILVYTVVRQKEKPFLFVTETDIGSIVANQRRMTQYFQNIFLVLLVIGFPVIFILSRLLTRPLEKGSEAAKRIAEGNYSERIPVTSRDEIGRLAYNFNQMAEQVEEKMEQLMDNARQKEDFAANFAHELKTPMTSVIGYADMLYQKDLSREEVKNAAEYILNEGMRLEALSLKLMDLFVLEKQEFALERMNVREIFEDVVQGLRPICKKNGVILHVQMQPGVIGVDYDLFKTMILNLLDNAMKADAKKIDLIGAREKDSYRMIVSDNGKGIPEEELSRITEAFYMVDKSRSRKQHGAGLGMALVAKILEIHEGGMEIKSTVGVGTEIMLTIPLWKKQKKEEEDA